MIPRLATAILILQSPSLPPHFGLRVASVGDLDRDGVPDFLVGDTTRDEPASPPGRVWIFSAKGGAVLDVLEGTPAKVGASARFGMSFAALGDLDFDGVSDFAVGAENDSEDSWYPSPETAPGYVRVYSGVDRRLIWEARTSRLHDGFGHSLAALGDLDHDGASDLAVGAPGRRMVRVFSGRSGSVLRTIEGIDFHGFATSLLGKRSRPALFGAAVLGPGDVDDDGIPDLVVGAPQGGELGSLQVISGATGKLMRMVPGTDPRHRNSEFGTALASPGDVDSDGVPDILAGRIDVSVSLLSGKDGKVIRELEDPERYGYLRGFADSLAALGDLDGDGIQDFAVGCEEHLDSGDSYDVTVVSGKDLHVIYVLESDSDFLVVAAAGDVDEDRVPDLLVGRWQRDVVRIYSGRTWKLLRTMERPSESR